MIFTRTYDPAAGRERVCLTDARPVEHLAADMHHQIVEGNAGPYARFADDELSTIAFIDDFGHRYVYKLTEFDPTRDAFRMELLP